MTVSWVFLAVAIWGSLWTIVAFRPPTRPGWLMIVGFFAAWSTTELAPIHLLIQLAVTLVFIALGALDAWPGWLALAITIASWLGLTTLVRGALQTDRAFADALRDALGPHWDDDLDPALLGGGRFEWRRVALPFWFKRRGVRRTKNIQYVGGDSRRRHRLDVYRAQTTPPGAPVLLQIHGGAWMISNKNQQGQPLLHYLAARGWVCVAINYGLSPRVTWPEHLVNCKRALAWVREHVAEYGGDPGCVVVTGGSAGGHLTALMGLTANDPEFQPGFEDVDTSVQAMVPFYGVFDWTGQAASKRDLGLRDVLQRYIVKQRFADAPEVYEAASPIARCNPDAPPALVIHGNLDTLAPVGEARRFVARMREVSKEPVVYVELQGAHHGFEVFNSVRTLHTLAGVDRFLTWVVNAAPDRAERSQSDDAPSRSA